MKFPDEFTHLNCNESMREIVHHSLPSRPLPPPPPPPRIPLPFAQHQDWLAIFFQCLPLQLFQCRKCRVQFPSREYLSRHTAYHTEVEVLAYKCALCPQRFSAEHALKVHVQLHSAESNFKCRQCTANFRSSIILYFFLFL
ncbi:unnamed protein product [Toxocara canis]|uniref:C2H2-type domain-containing protein n=1 Tax=Toxocara canis TaxID=6265 RepID=A0A3P7EZB0_TOXCA|nr:unnamed protein product [Toxocara canis]